MTATTSEMPDLEERSQKNQAFFNEADNQIWWLTVYLPVHGGWRFLNIGGRWALEQIGKQAGLTRESVVLELCCGLGDTCCYLASHFKCRVTGIDLNRAQLAGARRNLRSRKSSLAGLVRFVEGDVLSWQPEFRFHLIFSMDSLMYVPNHRRLFEISHRALMDHGTLALTEVLAGPQIDDSARQFMLDQEGVVSLPTLEEQHATLEEAGFSQIHSRNLTPLAIDCFETICGAMNQHKQKLVDLEGLESFNQRVADNETYRDFFKNQTLFYFQTFARSKASH